MDIFLCLSCLNGRVACAVDLINLIHSRRANKKSLPCHAERSEASLARPATIAFGLEILRRFAPQNDTS